MSDIIRRAAKGFVPAGYLPAPQQARFISTAEEAAKRLPASIKAQSAQNQLQKFGAKPLELEYAGLGKFLEGKDRVSSQEVLQHLQQQGPLGQLKRVDQGDGPERPASKVAVDDVPELLPQAANDQPDLPAWALGPGDTLLDEPAFIDNENWAPLNHNLPAQQTKPAPKPTGNFYQADVRAPFGSDPRGSFPNTNYARYTVPGQQGDYTGYREVLLEDPKTMPVGSNQRSQQFARMIPRHREFRSPVDAHASDYWLRYNNLPDRIAIQNVQSDIGQSLSASNRRAPIPMTEAEADQIVFRWEAGEHVDEELLQQAGQMIGHPDFGRAVGDSPLARDNNWKSLMLRHALLESVNQGGKPITLPTGQQMVDVEGFGTGSGSSADPVAKATRFNEDLANRLMKALREIHPKGGTLERFAPPEPHGIHETRPLDWGTVDDQDKDFYRSVLNSLPPATDETPIVFVGDPGVHYAIRAIASGDGSKSDWKTLYWVVEGTPAWGGDVASPQYREAALKMVQYKQLMREMGLEFPPPTPDPDEPGWDILDGPEEDASPGWTITPHPETVRAALQKGVPIMSLAPLLLAPQEEQQ